MKTKLILVAILLNLVLLGCFSEKIVPEIKTEEEIGKRGVTNILYVSPYGKDYFDGMTTKSAFKTVQRGIDAAIDGTTIILLDGVYSEETYFAERHFTARVTIKGQGNAVLDGKQILNYGMLLENSSNITVQNITFRNYKSVGLYVYGGKELLLKQNKAYYCGFDSSDYDWDHEGYGIGVTYSENVNIEGNTVYNCGPKAALINTFGKLGNGISTFALKNSSITGNYSYSNRGGGLLVEDGEFVKVENNILENHTRTAYFDPNYPELGKWYCGGLWIDGGHDITVNKNRILANKSGIFITNLENQNVYNYKILENYFERNTTGLEIVGFGKVVPENIIYMNGNTFGTNTTNVLIK